MPVRHPTLDEIRALASSMHMTLSDAELQSHLDTLLPNFAAYDLPGDADHSNEGRAPANEGVVKRSERRQGNALF